MASNQEREICYAFILLSLISFYFTIAEGETIGVCYGMNANGLPPPDQVVNLLKSNNIGKVRLYQSNWDVLRALKNSGIQVVLGVGNNELQKIASDQAAANGWVTDNVRQFYPATNIKYIAVGNEVFDNGQYIPYLLPAMLNILTALRNANLQNNIKISTPHSTKVLSNSYPPSQGAFRSDIMNTMSPILKFLSDNGSPFMAHVYPYFSYKTTRDKISADYALFRSKKVEVNDGGRMYTNLFDAMVDSLISAMGRGGYNNIPIVITESGWASAGNDVATVDNARTYNNNLVKHVLSNSGTPQRPGKSIETYIFALFVESLKSGDEEERHFGLFQTNKVPVYPVSFS